MGVSVLFPIWKLWNFSASNPSLQRKELGVVRFLPTHGNGEQVRFSDANFWQANAEAPKTAPVPISSAWNSSFQTPLAHFTQTLHNGA
jgi:hypothetical protein